MGASTGTTGEDLDRMTSDVMGGVKDDISADAGEI